MASLDDVVFPVLLLTQGSGILSSPNRAPLAVAPSRDFFVGTMLLERSGRAWVATRYTLREESFLSRPKAFGHFSRGWTVDAMDLELVDPGDVGRIRQAVIATVEGQRKYFEDVVGVNMVAFVQEAENAATPAELFDIGANLLAAYNLEEYMSTLGPCTRP